MDFLTEITEEAVIKDYLKDFPIRDWKDVIKKTLMYGIHSLKALENLGLASPKIEKIPALQFELAQMKKNIAEIESTILTNFGDTKERKHEENTKENSKMSARARGLSQRNARDKNKNFSSAINRGNSKDQIKQPPFRLTGKEKPEVRRKIPKYLQNIDSKIKNDVQKSKKNIPANVYKIEKKTHDFSNKWEEWKTAEFSTKAEEKLKFEQESQGSSSSFSTYNAGEDVKEFYQKEFSKFLPTSSSNEKKKPKSSDNTKKNFKFSRSSSNSDT